MTKAVEIRDLWVRYKESEDYAIKGVDLLVEEGEFVLLTGPSGCGKTTLCYVVTGIIPRVVKAEVRGRVRVFGLDPSRAASSELFRQVGIVFQNPEMQLITTSVYEEVAFPLENLGLTREEIRERVSEVLGVVGLKGLEDRAPTSLSGGQKQALAIASVLALKPRVVIMDEPTSMLDPQGTARVTELILRLREEFKMTIIAVEHRVEWAVEHVDRIVVMTDGMVRSVGPPSQVFMNKVEVEEVGFRPPQVTEVAYRLLERGVKLPRIPVTLGEAVDVFRGLVGAGEQGGD